MPSSPEHPGAISTVNFWLPIVLVQDLPPYFDATGQFEGRTPELEAYHLEGGLWCIAAVIAPDIPVLEKATTQEPPRVATSLSLHVLIYSQSFSAFTDEGYITFMEGRIFFEGAASFHG